MKKRVLVLLENGFEEIETVSPIDLLRRADAEVVIAATGNDLMVTGKTGVCLRADALLSDCKPDQFDALVIPGGPAAKRLKQNATVRQIIRSFDEGNLLIGAICAAPTVLNAASVLSGRRYTAHFSVADELPDILPDPVVRDGNLITSRGAGTAVAFGLSLVSSLFDEQTAREIASAICLP